MLYQHEEEMRSLLRPWMVILPMLIGGCGGKVPPAYGDGFPVVKPIDLVHSGATVEARFELPLQETGDPGPSTFLIGFRSGGPRKRPDLKPGDADFPEEAKLPLRVQLWKQNGGKETPVVLHELNRDLPAVWQGTRYQKAKSDVFPYRSAVGADSNSLVKAGKYDMSMAYMEYEVASAESKDLTPGKYRLKVTNLQDNPQIAHLSFELLVANYNVK
ncbi:hypothetical protein NDY24_11320 [Xanthomonas hortorum pv. pelargonii]|nr:hypothetical protein NDY24_11320 [Xanthomonas hortorum pv. pelargonii]